MAASGLLVRFEGRPAFIPSTMVRFIRYDVVVTQVPGTELGMALLGGRIVPVITLGPEGKALLVCEVDGEAVAFSGLEPIKSGFFEGNDHQPLDADGAIPLLPVRDYVERARVQRRYVRDVVEEDSWMS
jgi:hypothetical protein